jgi:ketosteroid isomerase-like protein
MERNGELEQFVADWFRAASRGDGSLVEQRVSESASVRLIGSDPDEVFEGGVAVRDFLLGEVEGAGGNATFSPADIEAFSEGSIGWATAHITISMPDGKHVTPRWTAIFRNEDGVWRFVQTHASIAVPNDEIGWVYPDEDS